MHRKKGNETVFSSQEATEMFFKDTLEVILQVPKYYS